jgi:hypothetical protein
LNGRWDSGRNRFRQKIHSPLQHHISTLRGGSPAKARGRKRVLRSGLALEHPIISGSEGAGTQTRRDSDHTIRPAGRTVASQHKSRTRHVHHAFYETNKIRCAPTVAPLRPTSPAGGRPACSDGPDPAYRTCRRRCGGWTASCQPA